VRDTRVAEKHCCIPVDISFGVSGQYSCRVPAEKLFHKSEFVEIG
jgi:hypothetical protein